MELNMNITSADLSNFDHLYEQLCLKHPLPVTCIRERTFDDVNYFFLEYAENETLSTQALGSYIPIGFGALGILGNLVAITMLFFIKRWSAIHIYTNLLLTLSLLHLCTSTNMQVLYYMRAMDPVVSYHNLLCTLWPAALEILSHIHCWTVALSCLHVDKLTTTQRARCKLVNCVETKTLQARLKCMVVVVVVVFLHLPTTFLRENVDGSCIISRKAGDFYRYVWPWIKVSIGIYFMWLTAVGSLIRSFVHTCLNHRLSELNLSTLCFWVLCIWYVVTTPITKIALEPFLYSKIRHPDKITDVENSSLRDTWLASQLVVTIIHSLAFIPVICLAYSDIIMSNNQVTREKRTRYQRVTKNADNNIEISAI